jgi:hypothetical protein
MKLIKNGTMILVTSFVTFISFQNCSVQKFGVDNSSSGVDFVPSGGGLQNSDFGNPEVVNPFQIMPAVVPVQGAVIQTSDPNQTPVIITIPNAQTPASAGQTTVTPSSGGNTPRTKIVTASNGCGTFDSIDQQVTEYHLASGECNHSYSNFVVSADIKNATEAFICFYSADQIESSANPAPGKCKIIQPMTKNPSGKFVWWSTAFWAFDGIDFTDYKVEVYSNRAMTQYVGAVQVGLRFPQIQTGQQFFTPQYHETHANTGWMSSSGHLVFFPACSGGQASGWKNYSYMLPQNFQTYGEGSTTCAYKILSKDSLGGFGSKKSCEFSGGIQTGYTCDFAPARADHTKSVTSVSRSGGTGTISGTCDDGKWTNVVISCSAVVTRRSCTFDGVVQGHSCQFQPATAVDGETKTSQSLFGGIGSVSAKCVDGNWENVAVNCTPKKSCVFEGGAIDGCRGNFSSASGAHGTSRTVIGFLNGALTGSVSGRCDDGNWVDLQINCQ